MSHHFCTAASRVAVITSTGAAVLATTLVTPAAALVAPAALLRPAAPVAPVAPSPAARAALLFPAAPAYPAPSPAAPASRFAPAAPAVAQAAVTSPTAPTAAPASVVQSALSKVGSPYRWGAAGPNAFDCSGLVQWSYQRSGVNLPRSSRAMSQVGTPVSLSQLRPGDLVFSYRPVSHVSIYIGNGQVVHASTSSSPVKVAALDRKNFSSARRV